MWFLACLINFLLLAGVVELKELEKTTRITHGEQATVNQFPYQASLKLKASFFSFQSAWCGGSIISQNWILTAAHCCTGYVLRHI